MRVVYQAENIIDAYLVRGVLEQAGLPAWVRGEHLAGGIGQLPAIGLIDVCVPDAAGAEARAVVEELFSDRAEGAGESCEEAARDGKPGLSPA